MIAAKTVNSYIIGSIRSEIGELRATQESGMSMSEWQQTNAPYFQRILNSVNFPTLSKVFSNAEHSSFDLVFDQGLDWVLNGITTQSDYEPTNKPAEIIILYLSS